MAKIVVKNAVKREAGKLYYIDKKGNVLETKMNRKGGKKGRTVCVAKKKAAPAKRKTVAKKTIAVKRRK